MLTLKDVEKIAELARLSLSDEEKALYLGQLTAVLAYADMLNELDLEGVQPTTRAVHQQNILREDIVQPSLPVAEVLQNAAKTARNQFQIQAVLGE